MPPHCRPSRKQAADKRATRLPSDSALKLFEAIGVESFTTSWTNVALLAAVHRSLVKVVSRAANRQVVHRVTSGKGARWPGAFRIYDLLRGAPRLAAERCAGRSRANRLPISHLLSHRAVRRCPRQTAQDIGAALRTVACRPSIYVSARARFDR
jgi:hypothetical protein